jgi:hypothetical protein
MIFKNLENIKLRERSRAQEGHILYSFAHIKYPEK